MKEDLRNKAKILYTKGHREEVKQLNEEYE
jgi:hypothetical protein